MSDNRIKRLEALAKKVARLNPDSGEIGEGMLRQLIEDAQEALPPKEPEREYKSFACISLGPVLIEPYFNSDGVLYAICSGTLSTYDRPLASYNSRIKNTVIRHIHNAFTKR